MAWQPAAAPCSGVRRPSRAWMRSTSQRMVSAEAQLSRHARRRLRYAPTYSISMTPAPPAPPA
jgi:hypothetical protein